MYAILLYATKGEKFLRLHVLSFVSASYPDQCPRYAKIGLLRVFQSATLGDVLSALACPIERVPL